MPSFHVNKDVQLEIHLLHKVWMSTECRQKAVLR